jgi:hypothetical protein
VAKPQPHPITHCVVSFMMILVVVALVDNLRLLLAAVSIRQELIPARPCSWPPQPP